MQKIDATKEIDSNLESTTTRTAGGLDFTAKGGKRQGREVPQSLRFGKPNHATATFLYHVTSLKKPPTFRPHRTHFSPKIV